jgi:hypothetical protein
MAALINIPPATPVDQGYREIDPLSPMMTTGWRTWFNRAFELFVGLTESGTTAQRPTRGLWIGRQYFDTDLDQQLVWNGTVWIAGGGAPPTTLTGDVTGAGTGTIATTIAADAVTYAKMQNVSTNNRLLGRATAGAGNPEEVTLGKYLTYTGTTLNVTNVYGQLIINTSNFQTINATWTPIVGYNAAFAAAQGVTQNAAAGTLTLLSAGQYMLTVSGAIAFTSSNGGRVFSIRVFNTTDSAVAAGPIRVFVGRDIAGANVAIMALFDVAGTNKALRLEVGNGDTFAACSIEDFSYALQSI